MRMGTIAFSMAVLIALGTPQEAVAACDIVTALTGSGEITTSIASRNASGGSPLCIAVRITYPARENSRYGGFGGERFRAPVVVQVPQYWNPRAYTEGFLRAVDAPAIGAVHIAFLLPGSRDTNGPTPFASDGPKSYNQPIAGVYPDRDALVDVLAFAAGKVRTYDTHQTLLELVGWADTGNIGVFAFSHPGTLASRTFADWYDADRDGVHDLDGLVSYFVGRENPTQDILAPLELGYRDHASSPERNVLDEHAFDDRADGRAYQTSDYDPVEIAPDYRCVGWVSDQAAVFPYDPAVGRCDTADPYVVDTGVTLATGLQFYSIALTRALCEATGCSHADCRADRCSGWPASVARLDQVEAAFPEVMMVGADGAGGAFDRYVDLRANLPDLRTLLMFSKHDHVQGLPSKPHIQQAFDGFTGAGGWARLNPDSAYLSWALASYTGPCTVETYGEPFDLRAGKSPGNWNRIERHAYQPDPGSCSGAAADQVHERAVMAALGEMMDRTEGGYWSSADDDLTRTVCDGFLNRCPWP